MDQHDYMPVPLFKQFILMKRVHLLLFIALYLFFPVLSFATEVALFRGKVIDADTKSPLPGATIYITDLKAITSTNEQGEFILKNVPAKGKFLLEVRFEDVYVQQDYPYVKD